MCVSVDISTGLMGIDLNGRLDLLCSDTCRYVLLGTGCVEAESVKPGKGSVCMYLYGAGCTICVTDLRA